MSKPPIGWELLTKTPIVKLFPTAVALKVRGTWGQLVLVALVRQTTPVRSACAGCVETGRAKIDPRNNNVTATSLFIQRSLSFLTRGVYGFIEEGESGHKM